MNKFFAFLALASLSVCALAQKAVISFATDSHDFGEFLESDGPVSFEFSYVNKGKSPLVLTNVQASCGCTTPEWTRTPVPAGGNGVIKVTFNPANRPGVFNKTITVQSNAEQNVKTLRISGKVLQKPKTLEDEYPVLMEGLRLTDNSMPFFKVKPFELKTAELQVVNTSDAPVTPEFYNVPEHIKIVCQPATINPGEKGVFIANYDVAKKGDWGFVSDRVFVIFNGQKSFKNAIQISATIEEDFSNLSEKDLADAPQIFLPEKSFDFGQISQADVVTHDFVVTNNGKQNLIIRKVKASCGCTAVKPEKTVLAKGESSVISVSFDPHSKSGRQTKSVTIITNDPKNSNVSIRISSNVAVPGASMK